MQNKRSTLGPRGWATLTLIGGATLASPFLRPPQVDLEESVAQSPLTYSHSSNRLASAQLSREASHRLAGGVADLADIPTADGSATGRFAPQLPAWATPPSPLDQLISQGAAPPWQHETASAAPRLRPLEPWSEPLSPQTRPPASLARTTSVAPVALPPAQTASPAEAPRPVQFVYQPGFHHAAPPR